MITSLKELPPVLAASVSSEEKNYITEKRRRGLLFFAVTEHFAPLACPEKDDPIRRQFFPDPRESLHDPFALEIHWANTITVPRPGLSTSTVTGRCCLPQILALDTAAPYFAGVNM